MAMKRITEREYVDRLANLFVGSSEQNQLPTDDETALFERYQDAEFDLTVDYRLGADFSPESRAVLRAANRNARERIELLKEEFLAGKLSKREFADTAQHVVEAMAKDYGAVLTLDEMTAFVGSGGNALRLPLTPESL